MKFSDLKFVRLTEPEQFSLIPRYLFEQVKGFDFKIERLYQFGPILLASPLTFLYALADKESSLIKGILWAEVNPLDNQLKVHAFSIDREYQQNMDGEFKHDSTALNLALDFIRKLQKENNVDNKIEIVTLRPHAYERVGWKKSKKVLMEI